jgi:Transposase domain (DUF772)
MRGTDKRSGELFSYVDLEKRVQRGLRCGRSERWPTRRWRCCRATSPLYSGMGRPSIPPEMLLRAMLLQAFYSIRSERQLMERLEFDLLFRWFVGLGSGLINNSRRLVRDSEVRRRRATVARSRCDSSWSAAAQ